MTVKEYLQKGRKLEFEIRQLKDARREAYELATGVSIDYSQEKVQTSTGNSSERKMSRYVEYCEILDERIEILSKYREKMFELINKLDNSTYRTLLISRYISCNTWEKVADTIHYNLKWTHVLHGRALKAIEIHYKAMITCKL